MFEKVWVKMINIKVDEYWNDHTVKADHLKNRKSSQNYRKLRLNNTPLHKEFMELDSLHNNEIILDYGCGPGNDIVNFITYSNAKKIIGIDVSEKALNFAKRQISLYDTNIPIEFIKITNNTTIIPLESNSVDYIICSGVLHHINNPLLILKEFFRILKVGSYIHIMVYNYNSIYYHIYIAYRKKGGFKGHNIDIIFNRNTDGENCPISRAYKPKEFTKICNSIGFETEYIGGYLSDIDSARFFNIHKQPVLDHDEIVDEHKDFVRNVRFDSDNYPTYQGKHCGIGGTYKLYKR